jgi:inosine-uridine nucleoside N-ribohydrolase
VVVETAGIYSRGMTIIDQRGLIERRPPNCDVLWDVDADSAFALIVEAIGHFSR